MRKRHKPAHEIFNQLIHDLELKAACGEILVGYKDRFEGIIELSFTDYVHLQAEEGVPFHRIRYFYSKLLDMIIWQRLPRLDNTQSIKTNREGLH